MITLCSYCILAFCVLFHQENFVSKSFLPRIEPMTSSSAHDVNRCRIQYAICSKIYRLSNLLPIGLKLLSKQLSNTRRYKKPCCLPAG